MGPSPARGHPTQELPFASHFWVKQKNWPHDAQRRLSPPSNIANRHHRQRRPIDTVNWQWPTEKTDSHDGLTRTSDSRDWRFHASKWYHRLKAKENNRLTTPPDGINSHDRKIWPQIKIHLEQNRLHHSTHRVSLIFKSMYSEFEREDFQSGPICARTWRRNLTSTKSPRWAK